MKRFTETQKWCDPWYRKLPIDAKLLWQWLCDNCDCAGVIDPDLDLAGFQIGGSVNQSTMKHFDGRIIPLDGSRICILKFIQFQYGKLSRSCKPHMPVFAALAKHGIDPDGMLQNETYKNTVDDYIRAKVISRDGLVCAYSGNVIDESDVEIDHIHPRVKGGTATMDNLVVSSAKMNGLKRDIHVHRFCVAQSLDCNAVFQRLSKATGKAIEEFIDESIGYLGSLKDKDKDKDKEQEQEQDKDKDSLPRTKKFQKPTVEEVAEYVTEVGAGIDATAFIDYYTGNGWKIGKNLMKDWKASVRTWERSRIERGGMVKSANAEPDCHLQSIAAQVMALRAGWSLPLATNESRAISDRLPIFEALTPDQWETLRDYLAARLPEGNPGWQPQGRLKFIESVADVWSYAEQWARKNRKIKNNLI